MQQDVFWNSKNTVEAFYNRPCSSYITNMIDKICDKFNIKNAIDIGCGGGRYSYYLKNKGIEVLAIDKNQAMVDIVSKNNVNAFQYNMSELQINNNTFDLALSIGVIHNAVSENDFKKAVSEISRILVKNGHAIVSIFTDKLITEDLTFLGNHYYAISNNKPPMILYSTEEVLKIFENNKLVPKEIFDEHVTNVGMGERNVISIYFRKE